MADEDETKVECKVEYIDSEEPEETNWIKRAGKAKVTYPNQDTFEGSFNEDKLKVGYGFYVWMGPDEENEGEMKEISRYEGNYDLGKKSGIGKMVFPNKDIYEGEWINDTMEGEGSYTYAKSKDIYSGSWKAGKKHGKGTYEYAKDKSMLTGDWNAGQFVTGKWDMSGYAVYEGNFEYQKPIGKGSFKFTNGLVQNGEFVAEPIEKSDEVAADAEAEEGEDVAAASDDQLKNRKVEWKADQLIKF